MAKAKGKAKKGPKQMGRPPLPESVKSSDRFGFRAHRSWKQWLTRFANYCRLDMVDLIDRALERYAKEEGFEKPPKR